MRDADVIVVGAGLTGLRAALELVNAGLSVLVVEQSAGVGGRMRTTAHDGFLLDHGFQVLLAGYPELKALQGLDALRLAPFDSGARIHCDGGFADFFDPRRHPSKLRSVLGSPVLSFTDLPRLFFYASLFPLSHPGPTGESTDSSITRFGFSERFAHRFLRPFLAAILLDPALSSDSAAARFYLRVFSSSSAVLPAHGIQALPNLLAQKVGVSHILLNSRVDSVQAHEVVLASGEALQCQRVVVCSDAPSAAVLGGPEQTMPQRHSRTIYFSADKAPFSEKLVCLNGSGSGILSSVAVPSNVQPSYAPSGKALVSATLLGAQAELPEEQARSLALEELSGWFGRSVADWRHLRTFTIPASVPARPRMESGAKVHHGVVYAGDYLSYGSQNGALRAGREAAALVLQGFDQ